MKLSESKILAEYYKTPESDRCYDFYRCYKCQRVFSREAEIANLQGRSICKCGSSRYTPSWPTFLEWLRPDIVGYTVKLVLARAIAPLADKYASWLLPYIERCVKLN